MRCGGEVPAISGAPNFESRIASCCVCLLASTDMLSDSQPHSLTSAAEEIRAFPGDAEESDSVTCNAPKDLTGKNCPSSESAAVQVTAKRLVFVGGTASWFHEIEHFLVELRPTWSGRHIA